MTWYRAAAEKHREALLPSGTPVTSRQAAELLGVGQSAACRFMHWFLQQEAPELYDAWRARSTGGLNNRRVTPDAPTPGAPPEEGDAPTESDASRVWKDPTNGTIYTRLGADYGIKVMTRAEMRQFRRDYSRLWEGKALNQSEMAIRWGFASAHAVSQFVKIHGLRQTSIPFDDDELEELGVDAAVDEALASRRQQFMLELQEKERAAEKRDAQRWRAFEVHAHLIAQQVPSLALKEPEPLLVGDAAQPYALIISLSDLHMGKLAHRADGSVAYDRREAARRAIAAVRDLLRQAMVLGRPDEIHLIIGSDGLQVDGPALTTSRGTSMAGQTDGSYREMLQDYVALIIEVTKICRAVSVTRLLAVEGNHDRNTSMFVGLLLDQVFTGDPRVRVERQHGDGVILTEYGRTTLLFLHGEFLKSTKDLFRIMITAAEERDMVLQPHRLSFGGHLHHERVEDLGGIKHHTVPALCDADEYHRRGHYVGSAVETQAFVVRRSGGKGAVFYTSPDVLKLA